MRSVSIACAARFATRRLHNVVLPMPLGKPCAGNPHARFERGSYSTDRYRAVQTVGSTSGKASLLVLSAVRPRKDYERACLAAVAVGPHVRRPKDHSHYSALHRTQQGKKMERTGATGK